MDVYKQTSYDLRKAIKDAKGQYRAKVESQFNISDTQRMWQGLQTITDYKGKHDTSWTRRLAPGKAKHFLRPLNKGKQH